MFSVHQTTHDYLSIVLTHECTRRCPFCIDAYRGRAGFMSLDHVRAALAFATAHSVKDILLIGGEPTEHPEIIVIAQMAKAAGFRCVLTTNYAHPAIIRSLDGIVDCFNVSFYHQPALPRQADFRSDLSLSALIHSRQLSTHAELDAFIDSHQENGNLKFSTLESCNQWAANHQRVPYLDDLDCEWVVLFNEILGQQYRGAIIKRYDRVINRHAHQSFKAHVDGQITQSWAWTPVNAEGKKESTDRPPVQTLASSPNKAVPSIPHEPSNGSSETRGVDWFNGIDLTDTERELAKHMPAFISAIAGESVVGVSRMQRRLRCGYNQACDLMDLAEKAKLVGPIDYLTGKRPVLQHEAVRA